MGHLSSSLILFFRQTSCVAFFVGASFQVCLASEELFDLSPEARQARWDIQIPRGDTREIDFHTSEGTWMSVDVSPDGRKVVFDLLGHIYLVSIEGGEAETLTQASGVAVNYHPKFSRDGARIAFISDRAGQNNVWVMNADGSEPRLVHDDLVARYAEPEWSADGRSIYATRFEPNARGGWSKAAEIWRLRIDGSAARKLIGDPSSQAWTPKASSDGRYLYYHLATEPIVAADGYYKISDAHHIRRLDFSTARSEHVTLPEYRWYYRTLPFYAAAPEISPDGRKLAFIRQLPNTQTRYRDVTIDGQTGLFVRDLETGLEELVAAPMTPAQFQTHSMYHLKTSPGFAWLPDGSGLVFSQDGELRRLDLSSKAIHTIPFRARVHRTISEMNVPASSISDELFKVRNPRWPNLSPDNSRLAFEAVGRVWVKDSTTGRVRALVPTDDAVTQFSPSWSPDGSRIAYASWSEAGGGEVLVVDAAGGEPRRIAHAPGAYLNPVWTKTGEALIALRGSGAMARGMNFNDNGWQELVQIPLSGDEPQRLAILTPMPDAAGQFAIPHITEEGDIHFTAPSADGSEETTLFSLPGEGGEPTPLVVFSGLVGDARISPDGRFVAYQHAHNIFVVSREESGGILQEVITDSAAARKRQVSAPQGRYLHWGKNGDIRFFSLDRYVLCSPPFESCRYEPLQLSIRPDRAQGKIALANASILTGAQRGFIERGSVLIENGRIACVGECDVASADKLIDLTGKYIAPGIVSTHAHNTGGGPDVFRARPFSLAKFLSYGVTTVMDPAGDVNVTLPQGELLAAGHMLGPRLLSTGLPLRSWGPERHEIYNHEDAIQNVDRLVGQGAKGIKQYFILNRFQRQWLSEASRRHGNILLTGEMMDLHYFLGAIMDGHTTLEHESTYWPYFEDYKTFLEQSGTYLSLTTVTPARGRYLMEYFMTGAEVPDDPRQRRFTHPHTGFRQSHGSKLPLSAYESMIYLQDLKDLTERGLVHGAGGHGESPGLSEHWELWSFALHSDPIAAWKAVTINSARYLGIDSDVGSIEVGKLADLMVLNRHPLKDLRASTDTAYVMKNGRLYESGTLDEVWPRKSKFGPSPWVLTEDSIGDSKHLEDVD